jgi:hypothetical protein
MYTLKRKIKISSYNETFSNCFKWDRKGVERGDGGGVLTNVQCKAIQNCHNESPLYNEYILIKMKKNCSYSKMS